MKLTEENYVETAEKQLEKYVKRRIDGEIQT